MKEQNGNGFAPSIAQAIEEMKAFQGDSFSLERINLAELERRTGVSRSRLRRLKKNSFQDLPRSTKGSKHTVTKLSGYTCLLDSLLRQGVKNSSVVLERLRQAGFEGGATIVKEYIPPTNTLFQPSASWLRRREIVDAGTPQSPEKPTRWTGDSRMFWITMGKPTELPALP